MHRDGVPSHGTVEVGSRTFTSDPARDPDGRPRPPRSWQTADDAPAASREVGDRPVSGQRSGRTHNRLVPVPLGAQETDDRAERRESQGTITQRPGLQPVLVELEPIRQVVGQRLVQSRDEEAPDMLLCHHSLMKPPLPTAAILAGGSARRFAGRDKSTLVVGGRSIIVRQLDVLQQVAGDVFVVANDPRPFSNLGVRVVADRVRGAGALGGLYTALDAASTPLVLVVACDLPFLEPAVLRRLLELASEHDGARITTPRGAEPLLACYRREAAPRVRAQIQSGCLQVSALDRVLNLAALDTADLARFGPVDRLLTNVNTPDDYARIQ